MGKKLSGLTILTCALSLLPMSVSGKAPTPEELLGIAREAYNKGLWKPNLNTYKDKNFGYIQSELKQIGGNDDIAVACKKTYRIWNAIAYHVADICSLEQRTTLLNRHFEFLGKALSQEDETKWIEEKALLKDLGTENTKRNIKECFKNDSFKKLEISDLEAFSVFFAGKIMPFIDEKDRNFTQTMNDLGNALSDFGTVVRNIRASFSVENPKAGTDAETFTPLLKAFEEKKAALSKLSILPEDLRTRILLYGNYLRIEDFFKNIAALEYMKKFDAVRRKTVFSRFKPKDLSKIPNDFDIFGLDKKQLKYSNPFEDPQFEEEEVKPHVQKAVEPYAEKFKDAYGTIGNTIEDWLRNGLREVHTLTLNAWHPHTKFDPEPVMKRFNETVFTCDIEREISRNTPNIGELKSAFETLSKEEGIDSNGVEKAIADAWGARFANTVMKYHRPLVTTLQTLLSHYFSLVTTVRKIEAKELTMSLKEARERVAQWLKKRDEYQQAFTVAEGGFYKTFFGGKKRTYRGDFERTVGDMLRGNGCFDILMHRLKKWKLLPTEKQPQVVEKDEAPKNLNIIIADKKVEKNEPPRNIIKEEDEKEEPKSSEQNTINASTNTVNTSESSSRPTRTRRGGSSNNPSNT